VLDRTFEASAPNRKWIADFTYVWTAEGWLYVAAVVDFFSLGWSMSAAMTAQFVTDALVMAIWRRGKPDALLHHSGRGSQGGFKRSSQRAVCWLIVEVRQVPLPAFSIRASCAAVY
jgi:putative transposase